MCVLALESNFIQSGLVRKAKLALSYSINLAAFSVCESGQVGSWQRIRE